MIRNALKIMMTTKKYYMSIILPAYAYTTTNPIDSARKILRFSNNYLFFSEIVNMGKDNIASWAYKAAVLNPLTRRNLVIEFFISHPR